MLDRISQYPSSFRDDGDRQYLAIVTSPFSQPYLTRLDFGVPTLFVADKWITYYTYVSDRAIRAVKTAIEERAIRSVWICGSSKSGFGAILWGARLARALPGVKFSIAAFSPMTELWPENRNICFPTYLALLSRARSNEKLATSLEANGRLPDVSGLRNLGVIVFYPERSEEDRTEALRVAGPNVHHVGLPMSLHSTILPFTIQDTGEDTLRSVAARAVALAERHPDMKATLQKFAGGREDMEDAIVAELRSVGARMPLTALAGSMLRA